MIEFQDCNKCDFRRICKYSQEIGKIYNLISSQQISDDYDLLYKNRAIIVDISCSCSRNRDADKVVDNVEETKGCDNIRETETYKSAMNYMSERFKEWDIGSRKKNYMKWLLDFMRWDDFKAASNKDDPKMALQAIPVIINDLEKAVIS